MTGAILLAASACAAQGLDIPSIAREPDEVLAEFVGARGLPGLACAVVVDGRTVYERAAGLRKLGSEDPVRLGDAFHLGSDTKAMTALLAAMMVDEGKLRWTSTIGEILGKDIKYRPEYALVTLEQLLSHGSGLVPALPSLPWLGFYYGDRDGPSQRPRMAEAALRAKPKSSPGSAYLYSNFNYVVAGLMIETVSGSSWEGLMRSRLFEPLGMKGAGFGPPDEVWGHDPKPVDPRGRFADNPPGLGPAGTARATLADLESYVRLYFDGGRGPDGRELVSPESMAELERPRLQSYALGWGSYVNAEGVRLLMHDGCNTMFYCSIVVVPEKRFAVIVLANRGDGVGAKASGELREYLVSRYYPHD